MYDSVLKQVYTNGTYTVPVGASGFLQSKILPFISGTEVVAEVIGVGDTAELDFAGILAHFPVGLRRLVITYTIGAASHTAVDDGSGLIVGNHLTGTLVHNTGAWTLTFEAGSAPDAVNITASYLYGYPGADWRVLYNRVSRNALGAAETFVNVCNEMVLHNTGLSGTENVWIGFREWDYSAQSAYGWDLNAYTSDPTAAEWMANHSTDGLGTATNYSTTWKHWNKMPMMPLTTGTTTYYIQSNQQCLKIETKVATGRYECMYIGFNRKYGTSSEYPFPIVIKAPYYGDALYSSNNAAHTGLSLHSGDTTGYNLLCVDPGGTFLICGGQATSRCWLTPRSMASTTELSGASIHPTVTSSSYPVRPIMIAERSPAIQLLGDLDGVTFTMGTGLVAGDIIKFDGIKHRVFPDVINTAYFDFFAISECAITTTT